jgi:hypothetical protein
MTAYLHSAKRTQRKMSTMRHERIVSLVVVLLTSHYAYGQQPLPRSHDSHKYRTIFTLAGGGGDFTIGLHRRSAGCVKDS